MAKFAEGTEVPAERSKAEIERTLTKFGADQFGYGWRDTAAVVVFRAQGRHIKFLLPMPTEADLRGMKKDGAKERETRRRWRALNLCIKAKLEAVATGIETFEESFMAHVVLPDGRTMAEAALPQIGQAYKDGKMPPLLGFDK